MKEKIFWTGAGIVGGLTLRAFLEHFVITSNWPDHLRGFIWGSLQDPTISITSWLIPGGILGLAGFFGPDAFRSTPSGLVEVDINLLNIGKQRGSARIAVALVAGLLTAGVGAGVMAPSIVDAAERILPEIGRVMVGAPAINGGRLY